MAQREKNEISSILRKESKEIVPVDEPTTIEERQQIARRINDQKMTELEIRVREKEIDFREKEIDTIKQMGRDLRDWATQNHRDSASQTIRRPDGQEIKVEVKLGEKKPFLGRLFAKKQPG